MSDERSAHARESVRHAVCTTCGYHLDGLPIEGDSVSCPECGERTMLDPDLVLRTGAKLKAPPRTGRLLGAFGAVDALLFIISWTVYGFGFAIVILVLVAFIGMVAIRIRLASAR